MPIACNTNNAHVHPKKMDHVRYRCVILKKHQYLVIRYEALLEYIKKLNQFASFRSGSWLK